MKLTVKNYKEATKNIDFKKLPEAAGYIGVTMPALSVKTCHFERCCNNTKN